MTTTNMRHMEYLDAVAAEDVRELRRKEETYRGSWKRRGGVGAFMMMARKWDRLESILSDKNTRYDVFEKIMYEGGGSADGTALAEIRDLRRYLLLVESEMTARGVVRISEQTDVAPTKSAAVPAASGDYPWFIRDDEARAMFGDSEDGERLRDMLYSKRAPNVLMLEPAITRETFDLASHRSPFFGATPSKNVLNRYVASRNGWYVLKIGEAPTNCRESWVTLSPEYNEHEYAKLAEWQKSMYGFDTRASKWIVRPERRDWTKETA